MKKIFGLLILAFSVNASALWLAEPYVGYNSGTTKVTTVGGATTDSKFTATGYGARLGYIWSKGIFLAAEYSGATGTTKADGAGAVSQDLTGTALGAVIGFQRGMWRIYGGYGFSDESKISESTSGAGDDITYKGTNMKVGAGFLFHRNVALNVEYIIPKYKKFTTKAITTETETSTIYSKFDTSILGVSLSFPFMFGK